MGTEESFDKLSPFSTNLRALHRLGIAICDFKTCGLRPKALGAASRFMGHSHRIYPSGQVLTPGRYVGAEVQEDDSEPFEEKLKRLSVALRQQQAEAVKLDAAIKANLKELAYGR